MAQDTPATFGIQVAPAPTGTGATPSSPGPSPTASPEITNLGYGLHFASNVPATFVASDGTAIGLFGSAPQAAPVQQVAPLHVESPVTDAPGIGAPHFGLGDDWLL